MAAGVPRILAPSRTCWRSTGRGQASKGTVRAAKEQRPLVRLEPGLVERGGVRLADEPSERREQFAALLKQDFFPLKTGNGVSHLQHMSVVNVEPPVLTCREFFDKKECDRLVQLALDTKKLQRSRIGGNEEKDEGIRTSTSLAIDTALLASQPKLKEKVQMLLECIESMLDLVDSDKDPNFGKFKHPQPNKVTFELPQIARYEKGQHFLMHEDAFPYQVALRKGYQRRATVLVYLNDVQEGGETRFDALDLAVNPEKGMALVFFPSFSNGVPDVRTVHTACDAIEEKFVFQLWISSGLSSPTRKEQKMKVDLGQKTKPSKKKGFGK